MPQWVLPVPVSPQIHPKVTLRAHSGKSTLFYLSCVPVVAGRRFEYCNNSVLNLIHGCQKQDPQCIFWKEHGLHVGQFPFSRSRNLQEAMCMREG